ncbi:hypothetical protein LUZ60_000693 [Juncus effusus]|nr:hypothetical protein LUZ60_000693 [Juncus effusus]
MAEGNGGGGEDGQKIKRIAAAAYDYENDARWPSYWSNVLIPPHMAARPDLMDHFKRKFYQRYIDPDFVVVAMASSSSGASSSSSQSTGPSRRSTPSVDQTSRPRDSGSSGGASSRPLDRRSIHLSLNVWVALVSIIGMIPIVPKEFSIKVYRLALLGTLCSNSYTLYTLHGKPRAWNLNAIQAWFQNVLATKEFIRLIYCLSFITSQLQLKFALIPVLIWALEQIAKFLRRNFSTSSLYKKYLEEPCLWIETNTTTLNIMSANSEIALGFLLIFSLLSWQRNIIQTFIYWQMMKLMYHSPATGSYHKSAWAAIGRNMNPYVTRYAPFLNRPVSAVQRWWFR